MKKVQEYKESNFTSYILNGPVIKLQKLAEKVDHSKELSWCSESSLGQLSRDN